MTEVESWQEQISLLEQVKMDRGREWKQKKKKKKKRFMRAVRVILIRMVRLQAMIGNTHDTLG